MKSKATIRRKLLATLMMLATAAVGLQPWVFASGAGCTCDSADAVSSETANESSCCNRLAEKQVQADCCTSKPVLAPKCCCAPVVSVCECGDCRCSIDDGNRPLLPAIPTDETTEVVTPVFTGAIPYVGYPRARQIHRIEVGKAAADFTARSSQETCALLSRFTC